MASYDAQMIRAVAIELRERVFDAYLEYLPIYTQVKDWVLNGYDPALPTPFEVKAQIDAYKAAKATNLTLTEWVALVQQAQSDDTLSYPTPPTSYMAAGLTIEESGLYIPTSGLTILSEAQIVDTDEEELDPKIFELFSPDAGDSQNVTLSAALTISQMRLKWYSPEESLSFEWDLRCDGESLLLPSAQNIALSLSDGSQAMDLPWNNWLLSPAPIPAGSVLSAHIISESGLVQLFQVYINE